MSMSFFSAASMTISVFSAVQVFAWIATIWQGRPVRTTAMWFALGFLAVFVIGGLNGIVTAVIPFDWQLTDTYFVVSHLHYVLVGTNMFPVFAAFYYWLPKITGRLLSEKAGKTSFWLMFAGFQMVFFPMHILGLLGMPRRIYTYPALTGWGPLNLLETVGFFILTAGMVVSIWNFLWSLRHGPIAGKDPWQADSMEWESDSPPAVYGTERIPAVATRHPLWDDWDEHEDPGDQRILDHRRVTIATSALDAIPLGLSKMPGDSIAPLLMALAMTVVFSALLLKAMWTVLAGLVACLIVAAVWLCPRPEKVVA
jgi:cytochrome c oxidase subunit 1/cytochrome c oxidase subunit I+III